MCGRFTQAYTWRELVALYGLTQPAMNLQPRYNIAPTATIDVLIPHNSDQLELWQMGWGLIPSWWTKTRKELPVPRQQLRDRLRDFAKGGFLAHRSP